MVPGAFMGIDQVTAVLPVFATVRIVQREMSLNKVVVSNAG